MQEQKHANSASRRPTTPSLPRPKTHVAKTLNKYKAPPKPLPESKQQQNRPTSWARRQRLQEPKETYYVQPLTHLALHTIADHFEEQPHLEGLDPKYALAITSVLSPDKDFVITGKHVNDEIYWERVCREYKGWEHCDIADHGMSWKQLFFERHIAESVENFGIHRGISREFENSFTRPPIDSTHEIWSEMYPSAPKKRKDGKPTRERFCKNGINCEAIRIARAPNSGWPALERLKPLTVQATDTYRESFAWVDVPHDTEEQQEGEEESKEEGKAEESKIDEMVEQLKPQEPTADDHGSSSGNSDEPEKDCDASVLREYLTPDEVSYFDKTGRWPQGRRPCILCQRSAELSRFVALLEAAEDNVFRLKIQQCMAHLDLELIMARLPNLASLELIYGVKGIGMQYDRSLLGMKISDAMSIAKCVKASQTLTSLSLPCNLLDDDLLRMLLTGLVHNQTVTYLDLSHNKITDYGAKLLTKILGEGSVVMTLNLADNQIYEDGGKYVGRALSKNDSLIDLNLRLNRLGDEGGRKVFGGLQSNSMLSTLNLSNNQLGSESIQLFCEVLKNEECALEVVDLSGNLLTVDDVEAIKNALHHNNALSSLDLRNNPDIPEYTPALSEISSMTRKNEVKAWERMQRGVQ
eukprot:gb/GECG01013965.1/.p1 GENE.gb/GECG01013965.1/~~gb/GECG01013965.1/.p1  ORF type:complete len:639 (+),score=75.65 gb/GECG01013965.1/:1-1917(+)